MRGLLLLIILFLVFFSSCDKGCTDFSACNYGINEENCKYSDEEELLLIGTWNLIDIHDADGTCLFSYSSQFDCELDDIFESITIMFNGDKTCQLITTPSIYSNPVPEGSWSINICDNILVFSYVDSYDLHIYPHHLPFGYQKIIQLSATQFLCEDLDRNTLHWEKI